MWSGFYVIGASKVYGYKDMGHNLFVQTNIFKPSKPTLNDFKKSRILPLSYIQHLPKKVFVSHFLSLDLLADRPNQKFELIGHIPCNIKLKSKGASYWDYYHEELKKYFYNPLYEERKLKTFKRFVSPFFNKASNKSILIFMVFMYILVFILMLLVL